MKKILYFLFVLLLMLPDGLPAQDPEKASQLVDEGIELHDKQEYADAIAKYDAALKANANDFYALAEKGFSLYRMADLQGAIDISEYALKKYPARDGVDQVYITLGNALDQQGKAEEAVDTYRKGIQARPGSYLLYYNLAITYARLGKQDKALEAAKSAALIRPTHSSSHFMIGLIMAEHGKRVPAILAMLRFLLLEPASSRSPKGLSILTRLMVGNAEKIGRKKTTINIDVASLKGEGEPDYFGPIDILIDIATAMDMDKKNRKKAPAARFQEKLESIISTMDELQEGKKGYFWENYVPYFIALKAAGHLEALVYIVHLSGDDKHIAKWLKNNENTAVELLEWMREYESERE